MFRSTSSVRAGAVVPRRFIVRRPRFTVAAFVLLVATARLGAQGTPATYATATLAGSPPGYGGPGSADGVGEEAQFYNPYGLAADRTGHLYIADANNSTIRKITPGGTVGTLAGLPEWEGFVDGTGSTARFDTPRAVAVAADGTVYVADTFNNMIRKITPTGVVTTLAGMPTSTGSGSADGTGSAARFNLPTGIAIDGSGMLYIADSQNQIIRKMTPGGTVTTLAGTAGAIGMDDGTGASARFGLPTGIAVDAQGNLYVSDRLHHRIRKVTPSGVVTTLAGSSVGMFGFADGVGSAATFTTPTGIAVDSTGTVYVTDQDNHTIRKITAAGVVSTIAGKALHSGGVDGTGSAARFNHPGGILVDEAGIIYVGDTLNHMVRRVSPDGVVTTIAGSPWSFGFVDGVGWDARFRTPFGIAVGPGGNLYIGDWDNDMVRKISPDGMVTMVAGSLVPGEDARFSRPAGTAVDVNGNVYVADSNNHVIQKIAANGLVSILAGLPGSFGDVDGAGTAARFFTPNGVAVDGSGYVYVADSLNGTIRKITPAGVVSTLAGTAGPGGNADGVGSAARFFRPYGLVVDVGGTVFVADTFNHTIRKITPNGVVTTFAGSAGNSGTSDGTGGAARFNQPYAIALDAAGNAYVADRWNHRIRKITPAGVVSTILGSTSFHPDFPGSADGVGNAARFNWPQGIAVDQHGIIYIADSYNGTIRVAYPVANLPTISTQPIAQTIVAGGAATFSVGVTATDTVTYQWLHHGRAIAGATGTTLTLPSAQAFAGGSYSVVVSGQGVSMESQAAILTVTPAPASSARLLNLSTRALCLTDTDALIPGFVLSGSGTRRMLIRGVGPQLAQSPFNLSGVLPDPELTLMSGQSIVTTNADWGTSPNALEVQNVSAEVGAFPLAWGSKDAAVLIDLPAGPYTAPTRGTAGTTGIAMVELYDAASVGPDLINMSNRGFVGPGDTIMIPGFVVSSEGSRTFLIRAVGPALALPPFGVPGVLRDPVLTVYRGPDPILSNDDWANAPGAQATAGTAATVFAFPLPSASADAAMVVTLPPGAYTVQASGKNGTTGVALVEVYLVP